MSFNITRLQDDRAIVKGTDINGTEGTAIVNGFQWFQLKGDDSLAKAEAAFNEATKAFYEPLTKATEAFEAAKAGKVDPLNFIVVQEATEGVAAQSEQIVQLTHDSKILRLIEEDADAPRLVWVEAGGVKFLEILAETPAAGPVPFPVPAAEHNGLVKTEQ